MAWKANGLLEVKFSKDLNSKLLFHPIRINSLEKSFSNLEKRVKAIAHEISDADYNEFENAVYSSLLVNEVSNEVKPTNLRQVTINKYSRTRSGRLFESVIIDGKPLFVSLDKNDLTKVEIVESVNEPGITLVPPVKEEYLHNPYEFTNIVELYELLKNTRDETVFSIYRRLSKIVSKYIDQDKYIITALSTNLVFSYFQDRFTTVHYLGIFGGNGNGKSSIGDVIEALGYRTMNTTDPSPANIFRSLGSVEPGQLTLVMDEADRIDQSPDMMAILKTGYHSTKYVMRVNHYTGKPEKYYTYCSKTIIAEKAPNPITAKGINDRILPIIAYPGKPDFDIKEISNPTDTGGNECTKLREEIEKMRKVLFCYRLLHFHDPIPNLDTGMTGRNKELTKPYIQLFSGFTSDEDRVVFEEINNSLERLLDIKNCKKDFTHEAMLLPVLVPLMLRSRTEVITFSNLWDEIRTKIRGHFDEKRPFEFLTEDYGILYRNSITFLIEKMGVTTKHRRKDTILNFNREKLMKTANQYNIPIQQNLDIPLELHSGLCGHCDSSDEIPLLIQNIDFQHNLQPKDIDHTNDFQKFAHLEENPDKIKPSVTLPNNKVDQSSSGSSLRTSADSEEVAKKEILDNIYRVGMTDVWRCNKCTLYDDIHFMRIHPCKGLNRKENSSSSGV